MSEQKMFGGNMERNVAFGLVWLAQLPFIPFGWVLALVVFLIDKDRLTLEDKRELVSVFVCAVANIIGMILSFVVIGAVIPLYTLVCGIIACVYAFTHKSFHIPGAYQIAAAIIK